jgi:hypothetical protein
MNCCYAIYEDTDDCAEPARDPAAVFADLEDAMEWAARRSPAGRCRIGYLPLVPVEPDGAVVRD